jgi:alcohol dehydrogenase YqhD (iron-dependent ADH family)
MLNFDFLVSTRLIFGKGTQSETGELLKSYGAKKVLLHYGGGSIKKSGLYDEVTASMKKSGVDFVELGGVAPNPRLSLVYKGIELAGKENADFILAVGGGSAIDSAKAIAVGAMSERDVWDYYMGKAEVDKALPVATILTIPAAGSETSISSVITNEDLELKYSIDVPVIRPVFSIMNPELFFTLPKNQMGYGVADIMSHIFERYFTHTASTDLTDALCEATLRVVMKNALIVAERPDDYNAWAQIGHGGSMAHTNILGLGREQEWSCHRMEHELSAIYDVAHGGGLAVLTPAWIDYVYRENIPMFLQFAVNVMGVTDGSYREPESIIREGVRRLRAFFKAVGLPGTLRELGIGAEKLELMAKKATRAQFGNESPLGSIKKLYWQDVLNIYNACK